jgi:hypothetical protein
LDIACLENKAVVRASAVVLFLCLKHVFPTVPVNVCRVSGELAAILKQQNNFNNNFTLSSIDFFQRVDVVDDAYMPSKSFLDTENSFETTPKSR